ncbi:hypothetical protein DPMN_060548 [Dreissena polymorpha]|uniref:Uncharacterized protein n=1 Tax=Dreissena polymorpha TaxID=45954 RepID=A0A9D4HG51_DREPO|nr:hypothetical protein DPMN_060548 [Dreissena polymorpha]
MQRWFEEQVSKMVEHIQNIIQKERMRDISLIILVGGFAESPYVQKRIQEALPDKRLIGPGEAGLAVLKGAVMFGHKPDIISFRVIDNTYGIRVCAYYQENLYPLEKKELIMGKWAVRDVFRITVRVNEDVPLVCKVTHKTKPAEKTSDILIYRTKQKNPLYITVQGCELLGKLVMTNDENISFQKQDIKTTFMFGDTELHVMSKNTQTGEIESLTLDLSK